MMRFLRYWLVLAPAALVASYASSIALFRHVDLTSTYFAVLLLAPLAQAAALAAEAEPPWHALASTAGALWRHPTAAAVGVLDLLILAGGIVGWPRHVVGFGAAYSVQPTWIAVKFGAAAVLMVAGFPAAARRSGRARIDLIVAAFVTAACGLDVVLGWSEALYDAIQGSTGHLPVVLVRLLYYGGLLVAAAGALLAAARSLDRDLPHAARLCTFAVACTVPAAAAVVLSMFNVPVVRQPWRGIGLLFASGAASAMLYAGVLTAWPHGPARAEVSAS